MTFTTPTRSYGDQCIERTSLAAPIANVVRRSKPYKPVRCARGGIGEQPAPRVASTSQPSSCATEITPRLASVFPRGVGAESAPGSTQRHFNESCASAQNLGPFQTKRCRGGVERRQLALKGVEGGD